MAKKKKFIPSGVVCILAIVVIFGYMGWVMGFTNMLNTIMKTAHDLLLNTVFYLMGLCVITGALGKLLVDFGVVDILQKLLRPVMKPLFNLPGVASLGAVLTFLSDNPAIISLCQDKKFSYCFKKYQHISLVISTFVMMMTFGGSVEGVDAMGNDIVVYTGAAYQGTQLLPWLASKISFIFKWLFGFEAPELVAFPITALGAVGAALGLVPEFASQGIIDENAIAVFTAMGMCWSGFLSTHAATLDSLGYRSLISRAYASHFIAGIGAGIFTHWLYVGITFVGSLIGPKNSSDATAQTWNTIQNETYRVEIMVVENGVKASQATLDVI